MQFTTSEVIAASQEQVFDEVTDFDSFERQIVRAGGTVARTGGAGPDAAWTGHFDFRGTQRTVAARVTGWTAPSGYIVSGETGGLALRAEVRCVPLDPERTQLDVTVEMTARTLSVRVLLNSVKLMRTQVSRRFKKRVRDFAEGVSHRAARQG